MLKVLGIRMSVKSSTTFWMFKLESLVSISFSFFILSDVSGEISLSLKEIFVLYIFVYEDILNFVEDFLRQKSSQSEADFTLEELKKAIKALKNKKASGPDRIPAEMLKSCPDNVLLLILKVMNKIKNSTQFPHIWGMGITSLLLKDGDDEDPDNYRAITVTAALSKILAILVKGRLEDWLKENIS